MAEAPSMSEAKRALVEKYLRGEFAQQTGADAHARQADSAAAESRESVTPVQTGGSEPPFFFLHGHVARGEFFYFPLARRLRPERPFYAVEPFRFDGLPVPPSFSSIAAAHLKSLRAVSPEGPYCLGGWCNGALLAYEMARQLHAEGQQVDQLVLMNPVYLRYPAWHRFVRWTIRRVGPALGCGEDKQLELYLWLRHGLRFVAHTLAYVRSADYRKANGFRGFGRDDYPGIYNWSAMDYAPPGLYPGRVAVIWSGAQPYRSGWRRAEKSEMVEVHILPGRHLYESLDILAERLRTCLAPVVDSRSSA